MSNALKIGLIALASGTVLHASQTHAGISTHRLFSNPVNHCQAFTPGPANTIRNRVVGAENIGPPIAVACNFHSTANGLASSDPPYQLTVFFANNNSSGTITVTCTLLTGGQASSNAYAVTKTTAAIPAGGLTTTSLNWTSLDNPTPGAIDLGNAYIGINCTLPTGAVINQTQLLWRQDNGVGT